MFTKTPKQMFIVSVRKKKSLRKRRLSKGIFSWGPVC